MDKQYFVYILTNKSNKVLYIGVTSNLLKRIEQHKNKLVEGFTSKYNVYKLIYFETHNRVENAITREKQIKKWNREWKENLIIRQNPKWKDPYNNILKDNG